MNCDQARTKLSDLLDGALPARSAEAVKLHLKSCAGCRRERALLALAVEGLSLLPARRPSRAFDSRVLALAAAARRRTAPSRAAAWALNVAASAVVLWTAVLAAFARPRLSVAGAELRVAQAGLSLPESLRAMRHAAAVVSHIHFVPGSALAVLPLQCMAAALIAGIAVAAAARPRQISAVPRRTR